MPTGKATMYWYHMFCSREYWLGFRDTLPLMIGVIPFGVTCGLMAAAAGLSTQETMLMSLTVFAGAAQFVAINMFGDKLSSGLLIVFTTLLINLRHLLMGASLISHLLKLPLPLQILTTFGMADETYAVTVNRIQNSGYHPFYQLGSNSCGYITWALSTAIGLTVGNQIPDPLSWGLDFAMPATFLTLLIPRLKNITGFVVFFTAALSALAGALYLPGKWYIIIACFAAAAAGGLMEERTYEN